MINEVWTQGNEMKHEQWSVGWGIGDETWIMKCGLKEIRWNMNSEVDNVTMINVKSWPELILMEKLNFKSK